MMAGGAERDRTADLVIANDALSQLSYSPVHHFDRHLVPRRRPCQRPLHGGHDVTEPGKPRMQRSGRGLRIGKAMATSETVIAKGPI